MSNIILYHTHTQIPNHLIDCLYKIRQLSKIPIYFLTDTDITIDDSVQTINIKKYSSLNWLSEINYFSNDHYKNLWQSSCYRMFYIQSLIEEKNLTNILHFDNDVLLYENPEKLIEVMSNNIIDYAITAHNENEVVMGMSFIKDASSLPNLLNYIQTELFKGPDYLNREYDGYPNEMQLISKSKLYNTLPILPTDISSQRYSKYFNIFNSVFDPSSYGQYLGGTFSEKKPGWFGTHQEIGKYLSENKIKVIMENKNPYILYNDQKIKINNLHIHSKETEKFL